MRNVSTKTVGMVQVALFAALIIIRSGWFKGTSA